MVFQPSFCSGEFAVNFPEEVYLEMHFGAQARPQNASDDQDDMRCLGFFSGISTMNFHLPQLLWEAQQL